VNIAFLTIEDPLYLPTFFGRVLPVLARRHTVRVFSVLPLYKDQSVAQAARRYLASFGASATLQLTMRLLRARLANQSISSVCGREGAAYHFVSDVNAPEFLGRLGQDATELLISVSCPQIFRKALIDLPRHGILNIHGAILPQYRGVMPSFWMLANGEKKAGVSIYFVNEKVDAGDLCGQEVFAIDPTESLNGLISRSKRIAADLLLNTIDALEEGTLERRPLDLAVGSYYHWPDAAAVRRFFDSGKRVW
jgi:methionyl-tRNA formyltransferase